MVFYHNLDPTLLSLGPFEIRWYGLMYVLTFLIVYLYARRCAVKKKINLTVSDIDSLMLWLTLALIIGARIFEVLFYNLSFYLSNPLEIIMIWHGGLSFHGGLVGVLIAGYVFARKKKVNFLHMADILVVPLALGQALGRIGNFINGELYGRITDVWWAVKFPAASGFRHPSQLYEAFYDIIIFAVLFFSRHKYKRFKHGYLLALFLMLYSVFRFLTEFVREPEIYIGPLTMGQVLNIPMFIFGVWMLYKLRKNNKKD